MRKSIILVLLAVLVSCKPKQGLSTTSESFRFVEIKTERKDSLYRGFNIRTQLNINEIQEREVHDTIIVEDPETKGQMKIWKDKYGNLVAQCEAKDKLIEKLKETIVDRSTERKSEVIEKDNRTWWQKLTQIIPWWGYFVAGIVLGFLIRIRL